jgi:hypothetical protein
VLSTSYSPAGWLIDAGVARGISDASARAHTITVYTDVAKAVRELGLSAADTIAVLLVERSGRILTASASRFDNQRPSGSHRTRGLSPNTTARDGRPAQTPSLHGRVNGLGTEGPSSHAFEGAGVASAAGESAGVDPPRAGALRGEAEDDVDARAANTGLAQPPRPTAAIRTTSCSSEPP